MSGTAPQDDIRIDPKQFRQVLGHLPTGVTVITAHGAKGPVGMAVNSFTSVSLDPALVLVCPAKASVTWPDIDATGMFCANVMAHRHQEISRRFAVKGVDRFEGVEWERRRTGPALSGAAAWVECVIEARHDAGDHEIVVCRVESIEGDPEVSPLVFLKGAYGRWADE